MTLRRKTLVIIGATLLGLLVAFFFITRLTLLRRFRDYEDQQARQQLQRASTALDNEISQLATVVHDDAVWDDAYEFVQDRDPSFLKSNFPPALFIELRIDLMIFLNSSGRIVFAQLSNQKRGSGLPQEFEEVILRPGFLIRQKGGSSTPVRGIMLLPDGPMMVAASPVLKSSGEGPPQGTLVMGRRLNAGEIHRLSQLTRLDLHIQSLADSPLPVEFRAVYSLLSGPVPVLTKPLDAQTIGGYELLYDGEGRPALIMSVQLPRRIHAEGTRTEIYLMLSAFVVGIVFSTVTVFLLEKLVLSRLIRLGRNVAEIGVRGDLSARVNTEGKDELSHLAQMINRMLADLERVENERRRGEERYRAYISRSTEGIWRGELHEPLPIGIPEADQLEHLARNLYFAECNDALARLHGFSSSDLMRGMPLRDLFHLSMPLNMELARKFLRSSYMLAEAESVESDAKGRTRYFLNNVNGIVEKGYLVRIWGTQREITEQRRLEAQLRQAQKMEAIGRLAGGVAHDFNNLLSVIRGYTEILLRRFASEDPACQEAQHVLKATDRAAALTQQLLAFGRKQVLAPRVLDLNSVVCDMDGMLRRLIREDIELIIRTEPRLGLVRADPAQMEQVILNLTVNAGDAVPSGGRVVLETKNLELDVMASRMEPTLVPGQYVLLMVSDTGIGMDAETRARIFEPFFTTKEVGKGTGLGLATVYGIVRQSGGQISVYSEPGQGSTFCVYLPRAEGKTEAAVESPVVELAPRGTGTVLLVEDDAAVRALGQEVLEERGYTVLTAGSGKEALEAVEQHSARIDLLVTDVIMPGMAGDELVEHLRLRLPTLRVVFVSGYASDAIPNITCDARAAFLQKPFPVEDLVRKVHEMIHST